MKQWIPLTISKKNCFFFCIFRSKVKKHRRLCLYICVGQFWPVLWGFLHGFIKCWQRWSDEARQWSIKRFIASIFKKRLTLHCFIATIFYSAINASWPLIFMSPLLFKRNSSLNASSPLLFKVTLPTSDYQYVSKTCRKCQKFGKTGYGTYVTKPLGKCQRDSLTKISPL